MQEGLPADLDEALRAMLRDLPQALPTPAARMMAFMLCRRPVQMRRGIDQLGLCEGAHGSHAENFALELAFAA